MDVVDYEDHYEEEVTQEDSWAVIRLVIWCKSDKKDNKFTIDKRSLIYTITHIIHTIIHNQQHQHYTPNRYITDMYT